MRKAIFWLLAMVLVGGAGELISALGLRVVLGEWVGYGSLARRRWEVLESPGRPIRGAALGQARLLGRYFGEVALHPYLGFVGNPDSNPEHGQDPHSRDLGFLDNSRDVLQKRVPERLVVGFFGGSMANILADLGGEALRQELEASGRFPGREVVLLSLAMGGYKQPQHLMALSYLLVLGGELDVAVTLDGFNEVALPPAELEPWNIFPLYPRNWAYRVGTLGPELRRSLGRIDYLEEVRRSRAKLFSRPLPACSLTAGLVWAATDRRLEAEIAAARESLGDQGLVMEDYQLRGPRSRIGFESSPLALEVETWYRGSLQMQRLCEANGITYFHFLQPNQYVPGSKPLSREELRSAYRHDHRYRPGVEKGYPLLRAAGERLLREGVSFVDLSSLFGDTEETLYVDDCCHVNSEGNAILARAIGRRIALSDRFPSATMAARE